MAEKYARVFVCLQIDDSLTAGAVEKACSPGTSSSFFSTLKFQVAIESIYFSNGNVDIIFALSAKHHFDDETFQEGRAIITAGTRQRVVFFNKTRAADLFTFLPLLLFKV